MFHAKRRRKKATIGEQKVIKCLKILFPKKRFKHNFRPDFLKNPKTGQNLELDFYHNGLKLGIEYNGMQHYEYVPEFHKTRDDFLKQLEHDELKKKICKELNIRLISISYLIPQGEILTYIKNHL